MGDTRWIVAAASVTGASHVAAALPCQDAHVWRIVGDGVLVVVAADGAGSAVHAEVGAALACRVFLDALAHWLGAGGTLATLDRGVIDGCLATFWTAVCAEAAALGATPGDLASTLLGAVVGADRAAFFQVGDGAIVVRTAGEEAFGWVFWPEMGEYANETRFVTDGEVEDALHFTTVAAPVAELALFTDGIQRLVLRMGTRTVHQPFFTGVMGVLRHPDAPLAGSPGADALSALLTRFLASPDVRNRTDDDTTLVLARRRAAG